MDGGGNELVREILFHSPYLRSRAYGAYSGVLGCEELLKLCWRRRGW